MEKKTLIEFKNVYKTYLMGEVEVHALRGVSLKIRQGDFLAVMGPSGSGKSTFMNLIGFLDRPSGGQYLLRGKDVGGLSDDELAFMRNREMGFVFQSYNLLPRASALENVELPLIYARETNRRQRAADMLKELGLGDRINHRPSELSGGQQQRVAIARALINNPSILLADEPTGNLDSKSGEEIMKLVTGLHKKGITIILVTHEKYIANHAQKTIYFKDGRIVGRK